MARKSRKETAAVAVQEADATCRAAIYVRLSVEDNECFCAPALPGVKTHCSLRLRRRNSRLL